MAANLLSDKAAQYLHRLCVEIPSRRVGSAGNQAATDFFAGVVAAHGFATECPEFQCIDWIGDGVHLTADGMPFAASASPYSLGCDVCAPLIVVSTVDELESAELIDTIVLLRGAIAGEPLMPKHFPFYNPDHHRRIFELLETKRPRAIVAAASRNADMMGAVYPFPLFEDGDFDIPSVYMTDGEGARLAGHAGKTITLKSRAQRIPSRGCNVIARKGDGTDGRSVLFAHIDARIGTPGANDNASGVGVLLLLAELLADYSGRFGIEIVAMNGEDYYAAPGEQQYLAANAGRFGDVVLGINLDDVAYCRGRAAYSLYGCPDPVAGLIRRVFAGYRELVEGPDWYQGDHGLFLMNQIPTLAITSEQLAELMAEITHSPKDTPEIVDADKMVCVAHALRDLLREMNRMGDTGDRQGGSPR